MQYNKKIKNNMPYILFAILSVMALCLLMNDNIWFDETYTLSLIKHDYKQMLDIIKSDMHPPLYFYSLKIFCELFGYSILVTKLFSVLGFCATLFLGCTLVRKQFSDRIAIYFMPVIAAIPLSFYFSGQQRCYSWSIFFVTLCFLEGLAFMENGKMKNTALFSLTALLAAYNHIYALITVAAISVFINIYIFIKKPSYILKTLLADIICIIGYIGWLGVLIEQTKIAADNFWLSSFENLSLVLFGISMILFILILSRKANRNIPVILGIVTISSVQITGLAVTLLIRPFYIARYIVPCMGILALVIALCIDKVPLKWRKLICISIIVAVTINFIWTCTFEYNNSLKNFRKEFEEVYHQNDGFIYCDSSFGIMSYYYPDKMHYCTYERSWFTAFDNVVCIDIEKIAVLQTKHERLWLVKNVLKDIPDWAEENYTLEKFSSFKSDFNSFDVYLLVSDG